MKSFFLPALCVIVPFAAAMPQQPEWEMLFNGKNLKNWNQVNGNAVYLVENGTITGVSALNTPNSFLASPKNYTNFVLEYEMWMDEGLNSGVQVRSQSLPGYLNGRVHGLQVECDDSKRAWTGGLYDEARKGWRYPLSYNPAAGNAYKSHEWNSFRILALDNRILTWVNGVNCANLYEETSETGFIALQVHSIGQPELEGKKVMWRNIRIRPATEADLQHCGTVDAPEVNYMRNKLTEKQVRDGWKLLWDGKTTAGWKGHKSDGFPPQGWRIEDGILSVIPSGGAESANGGDIVTEKEYENFILETDFLFTEGANSGIKYFVNTSLNAGAGSAIGCEFQILDDQKHPDARMGVKGNRTVGSLYDLITADGKTFNPFLPTVKYVNGPGQWNRARIVVSGNKVEHWLNGIKVVEYERGTQQWRALVAYSKYKDWPAFGEAARGRILLQDHGDAVSFCNVKILEL